MMSSCHNSILAALAFMCLIGIQSHSRCVEEVDQDQVSEIVTEVFDDFAYAVCVVHMTQSIT